MSGNILDDDIYGKEKNNSDEIEYDSNFHGLNGGVALLGGTIIITLIITLIESFEIIKQSIQSIASIPVIYKLIVVSEVILIIVLISTHSFLLYYFFKQKKRFIFLFKIYSVLIITYTFLNNFIIFPFLQTEPDYTSIFKTVIYFSIWLPYVYLSKQVKHTFVFR